MNPIDSCSAKNVSEEAQQLFETFWKRQLQSIENSNPNHFRNQELPLARIKKIMKLDEDVKMISGEAPVLFAKAVEIFISELSLRAWINTEENKRRTLQKNDISSAISKYDQFDFLIDIVPREETKPIKRHNLLNSLSGSESFQNYCVQIADQQNLQSEAGQAFQILQQPFAVAPQTSFKFV